MNLKTRIRSAAMRRFSSEAYLQKQRDSARQRREKQRQPPVVHYFHQVDDPYSHLAVQKLDLLAARYSLDFRPHLTSPPPPEYRGAADHFDRWAQRDAAWVAENYGVTFSPEVGAPSAHSVAHANQTLAAHQNRSDFANVAIDIGKLLWAGALPETDEDMSAGQRAVAEGDALRRSLGHYQGAMFYFDGEWFWGIDRIRLLEARLRAEGYDREPGPVCVPEPGSRPVNGSADGVLLEYFPSLRSPYTAIGHQRVLDVIERTGVNVYVRPVLPMMMRGIPAPRAKQRYIITDAGREGRAHGAPLGRVVDPFGEPVRRAFALFPAANAEGRGMHFVTEYLRAAWVDGIDITTARGLAQVVQNAGLQSPRTGEAAENTNWEAVLTDNLHALTQEHLWGVPSFRVSGGNCDDTFACWGQGPHLARRR